MSPSTASSSFVELRAASNKLSCAFSSKSAILFGKYLTKKLTRYYSTLYRGLRTIKNYNVRKMKKDSTALSRNPPLRLISVHSFSQRQFTLAERSQTLDESRHVTSNSYPVSPTWHDTPGGNRRRESACLVVIFRLCVNFSSSLINQQV